TNGMHGASPVVWRGAWRLRQEYPLLRSTKFLHGQPIDENGTRNVVWYRPDGLEMDAPSWNDPNAKAVGLLLRDPKTQLLILVSAFHEKLAFKLPGADAAAAWSLRI